MRDNDRGCITVVKSYSDMKLVGTITDRDITIRSLADTQNPMNMEASDVMTAGIVTATPETGLSYCFDLTKQSTR